MIQNNNNQNKNIPLYLDVDDVILNSSETILALLKSKYPQNLSLQSKSISDLHDWGYKSFLPTITREEVESMFESPQFWSTVRIRPDFLTILRSPFIHNYQIHLTTHCSPVTQPKKETLLSPIFSFYNLNYDFAWVHFPNSKSIIDMTGGIQVDDVTQNLLDTNSSLKILLTNSLSTSYNQIPPNSNIYSINTLSELHSTLQFFNQEETNA